MSCLVPLCVSSLWTQDQETSPEKTDNSRYGGCRSLGVRRLQSTPVRTRCGTPECTQGIMVGTWEPGRLPSTQPPRFLYSDPHQFIHRRVPGAWHTIGTLDSGWSGKGLQLHQKVQSGHCGLGSLPPSCLGLPVVAGEGGWKRTVLAGHHRGAPLTLQAQSPCSPGGVQIPARLLEVGEAHGSPAQAAPFQLYRQGGTSAAAAAHEFWFPKHVPY